MTAPNVLWILVDQLRYQSLSCHGDPNIRTPNLDRLAEGGASLGSAFTPCPVCTPARGAIFTGQYSNTTGIRFLGDLLPPGQRTVAHAFREAGYRTSYVGKWHLASAQNPYGHNEGAEYWVHPLLRGGFEDWFGFELSNHFWKTRYCSGEVMWPPIELEGYQTDGLTSLTLEYLKGRLDQPEQPWFHVLSLEAPHHGSDADGVAEVRVGGITHTRHPAPPEYEARFKPEDLWLRGNVPQDFEEAARSQQAEYYAMIANLDDNVGRILDWLEETDQAENTLVVFFSDHGEMGGSHGRFQKCVPYQESAQVPVIVRWPGQVIAGTTPATPFSLVDLLPTTLSLTGLPVPSGVQGFDLASVLLTGREVPRAGVLGQWFGNPRYQPEGGLAEQWRSLHTDRYTYAVWQGGTGMLFDRECDPEERSNRYGDPASRAVQMSLHQDLRHLLLQAGEPIPDFVAEADLEG